MNWFQRHRQEFILEKLRTQGFVQRKDLTCEYGISTQQASSDFTNFQAMNPGLIEYDKTGKCYRPAERVALARKARA
jgi:hypothetical protein